MAGVAFDVKKAVLDHRRAVVPAYRDLRDRPTWELLDVLYLSNDPATDFGGGIETSATSFNVTGVAGSYIRKIGRKNGHGELIYDGTRQMSQLALPFTAFTNNRVFLMEDFYLIGPDNRQNLVANGLSSFDQFGVEAGGQIRSWIGLYQILPRFLQAELDVLFEEDTLVLTSLPAYNLSVTFASGSWTTATNVIINPNNFDPDTGEQPIEIYRALN